MESILYLMLEKKKEPDAGILPAFHISALEEKLRADSHFLAVSIPWACLDPWELSGYLQPFLRYSSSVDTVYDPSLTNWLGERRLGDWWKQGWPYPDYTDYHRRDHAAFLWKQAEAAGRPEYILVLGYADFVPEVLKGQLRNTKGLRFIVNEMPEGLEDWMEEVYEEYGLAVACEERKEWKGWRPVRSPVPALILDLSGEERSAAADLADGSIWLDMDSMTGKRRRLENSHGAVSYFSARKEWERLGKLARQRRLELQTLDTICKNRYNT